MANVSKEGQNKSEAIRNYVQENPDAKPKEIVEALAKLGLEATPAYVSTIKTKMKSGDGGSTTTSSSKGRGRKASTATATSNGNGASQTSVDQLVQARKFVDACGGLEQAQSALKGYVQVAG